MHTDLQINLLNNLSSDNDSSISSSSSSASSIAPVPPNSTSEPAISNITQTLNDLNFSNNKNSVINDMFDNIFEQITLGIYFDIYKSFQMNSIKVADNSQFTNDLKNSEPQNKKCDKSGVDIFGHSLNGIKKLECICPNCSRTLAASRLAPHLEKCMGMGRNSSRLASKRIALFIKNSNGASSE